MYAYKTLGSLSLCPRTAIEQLFSDCFFLFSIIANEINKVHAMFEYLYYFNVYEIKEMRSLHQTCENCLK
jgi:hypothetical protein